VKYFAAIVVLGVAAILAIAAAHGGHEFPVYPSYYPHDITLETMAPDAAAEGLRSSKIQAYIGPEPGFGAKPPDSIAAVESLGSFIVVRVNPGSALVHDGGSTCTLVRSVIREIASHGEGVTIHPYPVTPLHGDYLYHADLAEAARARFLQEGPPAPHLKVRLIGTAVQNLVRRQWATQSEQWDASVEAVDAETLVEGVATQLNGWMGPPWLRTGWFQAALLLAPSLAEASVRDQVQAERHRLEAADYAGPVERINLERDLVTALTARCDAVVAGFTTKREYFNTDYSAGIENIGYDFITGFDSPTFIRTVKLKDFPWNGWLAIGIDSKPTAAWNPIAGFNDRFGRLLWSALGDPALIPAPNDAGWMLNRISDVQSRGPRR